MEILRELPPDYDFEAEVSARRTEYLRRSRDIGIKYRGQAVEIDEEHDRLTPHGLDIATDFFITPNLAHIVEVTDNKENGINITNQLPIVTDESHTMSFLSTSIFSARALGTKKISFHDFPRDDVLAFLIKNLISTDDTELIELIYELQNNITFEGVIDSGQIVFNSKTHLVNHLSPDRVDDLLKDKKRAKEINRAYKEGLVYRPVQPDDYQQLPVIFDQWIQERESRSKKTQLDQDFGENTPGFSSHVVEHDGTIYGWVTVYQNNQFAYLVKRMAIAHPSRPADFLEYSTQKMLAERGVTRIDRGTGNEGGLGEFKKKWGAEEEHTMNISVVFDQKE